MTAVIPDSATPVDMPVETRRKVTDLFTRDEIAMLTERSDLMGFYAVGFTWAVIGLLAISRWTKPGTSSTYGYNHYALLGSVEAVFGLPRLGYAATPGRRMFGLDVYNSSWQG